MCYISKKNAVGLLLAIEIAILPVLLVNSNASERGIVR